MAGNRTVQRWARVYMDGYDMSGYARSIGALPWSFDEANLTALADSVKGYLPALCNMSPSTIDGNLDTTATSGLHAIASAPGVSRVLTIPFGINAEPVAGDWAYCGRYNQASYQAAEDGGAMVVNMAFDGWDAGAPIGYDIPWGRIIHAKGAETGVNTAVGIDGLAASAFGGYLIYHVFAGDGTATIKVQDAATNLNASFADLTGATSGAIDCATVQSGIVAIGKAATVRRYLRWQIVLGTANTVTFSLVFVRSTH